MKGNPYYELEWFLEAPIAVSAEELRHEIQRKINGSEFRAEIVPAAEKWLTSDLTALNLDKLYTKAKELRFAELQKIFADEEEKGNFDFDERTKNTLSRIEKKYPYFHSGTFKAQLELHEKRLLDEYRQDKRKRRQIQMNKRGLLDELLILLQETELYDIKSKTLLEQCRKQIAALGNVNLMDDSDIYSVTQILETHISGQINWRPDSWSRFESAFSADCRLIYALKKEKNNDSL